MFDLVKTFINVHSKIVEYEMLHIIYSVWHRMKWEIFYKFPLLYFME